MSTRRRDIRRPGEKRGYFGPFIFFIFALCIFLVVFFIGTSPGKATLLSLIDVNSSEELLQSLESENKELRTEIDLLKSRARTFSSTVDDFKIQAEDFKRDIRFLRRDIEEKEKELARQKNSPINSSTKTISQQNRVEGRPSSKDESVYREVDLSRAQKLVRPQGGPVVIYPRQALNRGLTGKVTIRFDISKQGIPINIRATSSRYPLFNKAAIDAVKKFVYLPARDKKGNEIIVKDINYPFSFELN